MDRASLGELMLDVVLAEEEGVLLFPPQLLCPCFTLYISLYICIVFTDYHPSVLDYRMHCESIKHKCYTKIENLLFTIKSRVKYKTRLRAIQI